MTTRPLIVTGTDTGIGKTVFAAGLAGALQAHYWKPIQAGLDEDHTGATDAERVTRLSGLPPEKIVPEVYKLETPCSPHRAAEIDGVTIDPARLDLPNVPGPLIIEGAGGVLVPISRTETYVDQFARWGAPAVLVARTQLGTINHTLLSIEALRSRGVPILGIAFVGLAQPDSEATIEEMGGVRRLGRLPPLNVLTRESLTHAFAEHFRADDFLAEALA